MTPTPAPEKPCSKTNRSDKAGFASFSPQQKDTCISPGAIIRPIQPQEIDQALELLVSDLSSWPPGVEGKTEPFRRLAQLEQYDLTRQIVAVRANELVYACLFVPRPGKTAFVFTARPDRCSNEDRTGMPTQALGQLCQWAFREGNSLLQVLLEPVDMSRRELCLRSGFRYLTDLIYLFRLAHDAPLAHPPAQNSTWIPYESERHELFKTTVAETYRQSLDCPELENLREMEDIMCGHKASGQFDPGLWKLLVLNGKPVGVLLLSPLRTGECMELTYMGLCPEARGRGLGKLLLAEALACAHRRHAKYLSLAVDCRNQPAYYLYTRAGFTVLVRRTVLLYSSNWL